MRINNRNTYIHARMPFFMGLLWQHERNPKMNELTSYETDGDISHLGLGGLSTIGKYRLSAIEGLVTVPAEAEMPTAKRDKTLSLDFSK